MGEPFESAKFSLKRAHRHALDFNALAREYMESDAYTVRNEYDSGAGVHEIKVRIIRYFPEDLRGYASDAIKNIRDALDQAMSAATFVITGRRGKRSHFPFGESEDDLENSLSRRKAFQCKGIPEELFPLVRCIKPYPHDGDNFRLKLLQKVSGPHKHSVALTLATASAQPLGGLGMSGVSDDGTPMEVFTVFHEWDSTEEEMTVATTRGLGPDGKVVLSQPFHIGFDHPELRFLPASQLMHGWGLGTDLIIQALERESATIAAARGR